MVHTFTWQCSEIHPLVAQEELVHFISLLSSIPLCDAPHFIYLVPRRWTLGLLPVFDDDE